MKINELKPRMNKVDIEVEIAEVGPVKEFNKSGNAGRVATAVAKDDTGEIKLSLWNAEIDKVKPGIKVKITDGFVNEFQGEMQLTTGRSGKLEVIA